MTARLVRLRAGFPSASPESGRNRRRLSTTSARARSRAPRDVRQAPAQPEFPARRGVGREFQGDARLVGGSKQPRNRANQRLGSMPLLWIALERTRACSSPHAKSPKDMAMAARLAACRPADGEANPAPFDAAGNHLWTHKRGG